MNKIKSIFFFLLLLIAAHQENCAQYTQVDVLKYIDTYKDIAAKKMMEYKIPASITLAQGIFESACGTSRLATEANNHFGIKCHTEWTGDTVLIDDDALGECFRKYNSVEESFQDHSYFLTSRNRYSKLFDLSSTDYKSWAYGLKEAGYATNPKYPERLIALIEKYNINVHDTLAHSLTRLVSVNPESSSKPTVKEKANDSLERVVFEDRNVRVETFRKKERSNS
ncbi:MAG: glucosaminidase domain-containing protein, partial [Bacteroidales bacterium]|nr:glucosaminidase domain-containing protein [Bacteroidales bacterium]